MRMRRVQRAAAVAVGIATAIGSTAPASAATVQPALGHSTQPSGIQHVLLISVDGLTSRTSPGTSTISPTPPWPPSTAGAWSTAVP